MTSQKSSLSKNNTGTSATVITKTNIHVWCAFLLSALPFRDMFHIYGVILVPHLWRSNGRFWAQKNIFCLYIIYILKMIFPCVKHKFHLRKQMYILCLINVFACLLLCILRCNNNLCALTNSCWLCCRPLTLALISPSVRSTSPAHWLKLALR